MFKNRHFMLLWGVNVSATLAIELFMVTVIVAIFEATASPVQAAGAMVARMLPSFLLGPIVGVLVDRLPRKRVLVLMDFVRLLLVGAAIWFLQTESSIPVVGSYFILAGLAAADAFHRPARMALIPLLVPHDELVTANSFILASGQILMAVSYTLGGWMVQFVPLRQIATGISALFAVAILCGVLIQVAKEAEPKNVKGDKESIWQAFMAGWRYLNQHSLARPLTIMEVFEHIPHGIWTGALMLTFTTQALMGDTADWGYQVTGYFTGMIVGSFVALAMSDWLGRHAGRIIVTTAALAGVLTFIFAFSPTVMAAVAIAFVFGPPFAIRDVAQDALLQATVEEKQLGRVYATREMLRNVVFMLAGLFFAWLAGFVSIRLIYMSGGVLYILTGIYALSNRALRESTMTVWV